jgi:hypothetical protein
MTARTLEGSEHIGSIRRKWKLGNGDACAYGL